METTKKRNTAKWTVLGVLLAGAILLFIYSYSQGSGERKLKMLDSLEYLAVEPNSCTTYECLQRFFFRDPNADTCTVTRVDGYLKQYPNKRVDFDTTKKLLLTEQTIEERSSEKSDKKYMFKIKRDQEFKQKCRPEGDK